VLTRQLPTTYGGAIDLRQLVPVAAALALVSGVVAPHAVADVEARPVTAADLGATWRPECPVAPAELRLLTVNYLGFDDTVHRGELVVHRDVVDQVAAIFDDLLAQRYPIAQMQTVDHYPGADDELSMRDNNTSAFNCRDIPGSGKWSWHAYGLAIDLNPLINPYVERSGAYQPATAGPYVDRGRTDPGVLHAGDPAVRVFTDRGWAWGGYWTSVKDYQHFELPPT
jgi:hypothetical protein